MYKQVILLEIVLTVCYFLSLKEKKTLKFRRRDRMVVGLTTTRVPV